MKILNYFTGIVAGSLTLAGWAILNVLIAPALGAWVAIFNVAYILAATIFVSHYFNLSIPGVRLLLRRAYYRAKFKAGGASGMKKAGPMRRFYVQFLVYLIWLFKETEEGFETVKDEAEHLYSSALLVAGRGSGSKKVGKKELIHIHKRHQNRATTLSLLAMFVLVIGTVITGLISSFLFPAVFQSQAATYTWEQVDWSGGATSSVAVHPDDTTGWTYYDSKDSNILVDGDGNITLDSTSQEVTDSSYDDFMSGDVTENNDDQRWWVTWEGDLMICISRHCPAQRVKDRGTNTADEVCEDECGELGPGWEFPDSAYDSTIDPTCETLESVGSETVVLVEHDDYGQSTYVEYDGASCSDFSQDWNDDQDARCGCEY